MQVVQEVIATALAVFLKANDNRLLILPLNYLTCSLYLHASTITKISSTPTPITINATI